MKKLLCIVIAVLLVTGCAKSSVSTKEIILENYKTICNTNDTSVMRSKIAELEKLSKDETISDEERMFAQYSHNIAYGIVKLSLSGKSISVFDFPEMEILSGAIGLIANDESEITDVMVSESEKFVQKVENFLQ